MLRATLLPFVVLISACGAARADFAVTVVSDVAYLPGDRAEKLDLYLPQSRPAGMRSPAMVIIHGGGWGGGDKAATREKQIGPALASAGFVCASINYRLGAGAWPQNLYDCKNAVRFLRARAADYSIDSSRVAVMGGSAGGHLALMVAYTTDKPGFEPDAPYPGISSRVGAVINLYGVTNILTRVVTEKDGRPTNTLRGYTEAERIFGPDREVWRSAMPVSHVNPRVPPTLILHGRADTTVDYLQAIELAKLLEQHGVPHALHLIDGIGHTFNFEKWGKVTLKENLRPLVLAFLEQHLRADAERHSHK
jgi:acetyl esterase/lipase